ncbi:MAG: diaminopropionate ammonia-lyase [Sphingomonadales bacterium]
MVGTAFLFSPSPLTGHFLNKAVRPVPKPFPPGHALSLPAVQGAVKIIKTFPGYSPTPLRSLAKAAEVAGLGQLFYKDESLRFDLKNFKAVGGAYAVLKLVEEAKDKDKIVITSSTAGSHGRSIAWGAKMAGVRCVIFIAEGVSRGREKGMTDLGAEVIRVPGRYEESFQAARKAAARNGWQMVCDTTFPGYEDIPLTIMQGYGSLVEEICDQLQDEHGLKVDDLTHVFLQAGCGGFAAGIMAAILGHCRERRPRFILVEPEKANCVLKSMEKGSPVFLEGDISTLMGGLEVAEVSMAAWPIMSEYADGVLAISDQAVAPAMKALAEGAFGGGEIEAGESAPAGLIGALAANADEKLKQALVLNKSSKVLVFGTEGAADPEIFEEVTGRKPFVGDGT